MAKENPAIKPRPKLTFVQWIVFTIVFAVIVFGFQTFGLIKFPSFNKNNSGSSNFQDGSSTNNNNVVSTNNPVSGKPSSNTDTQKLFLKIDSGECKSYREVETKNDGIAIDTIIVGSGSAGGRVGDGIVITTNPGYTGGYLGHTDFGEGLSCSSWTAKKSQGADYSYECVREQGQPFTTTWTIIAQGPNYATKLGRERSIYLMGYHDGTQPVQLAFSCLTNGGW